MGGTGAPLTGPDFADGVAAERIVEGKPLLGHAHGEPVLLARTDGDLCAVSATCPHYGAPLADGLQVGNTLRCPWHHARFDLRTGAVECAPAFRPLTTYEVEQSDGLVRVSRRREVPARPRLSVAPARIVIVGAGAAGHAAAETLRREGYDGTLTVIGADPSEPYDRPNLSKDYLAGTAPEEWIPLRERAFYDSEKIALRTGVSASRILPQEQTVELSDGSRLRYDALLLATGAEPIPLRIPGGDLPHVQTLRTLADARAIIGRTREATRAVVLGASFIGLEVAASLRTRGLEVHVVAPEPRPLERVFGPQVGDFIRGLHEAKGVVFHLGQTAAAIDASRGVTLQNGEVLPADLVVVGIGVRPATALAESAGLVLDRGVKVDSFLQTSTARIWAAGDIARWPDPHSRRYVRVEHWAVAQRQGQTAAHNMLGRREPFEAVPFFWTTHYDVPIAYVGYAETWDSLELDGSLADRDCTVRFNQSGRTVAMATIGRDHESLLFEAELEARRRSGR